MYTISVVMDTETDRIVQNMNLVEDGFYHVKYLEVLRSAEELFDRRCIVYYDITLYKYKGEGNGAERIIFHHKKQSNIH